MKIPQIMFPPSSNYRISGDARNKYANKKRYYCQGLFSTLVYLQPKVCLEIGTHRFHTAGIFQKYFDDYCTDGILITVDIKAWSEKKQHLKNVHNILVHPHLPIDEIKKWHPIGNTELKYIDYVDSVKNNINIISQELSNFNKTKVDFCFIDGDHQRESLYNDIKICESLSTYPHMMLLDDTHDFIHQSAHLFHNELEEYNKYDFDDWDLPDGIVGNGLIWHK